MPILSIFNRHSTFAAQADAYADGELRGRELERFEAHLAACPRCAAAVANAHTLKVAIATLPVVEAPRSFRVTPGMLEHGPVPKEHARPGTPLYLGLARATAALSVAAFATALVLVSANPPDGDRDEAAGAAFDTSGADGASLATPSPGEAHYESAAEDPQTPQIAPATTGGAAGSGLEPPRTVATETIADRSSSQAPSTAPGAPDAGDDQIGPLSAAGLDLAAAREQDDDGGSVPVLALGAVAVVAVIGLAALEINRRRA